MTKRGNHLTKEVWERVEITKQQYKDILTYGCKDDFDELLLEFFRSVVPRTNEVELLKFSDIDFDNNECVLYAKWIRPKGPVKPTEQQKKEYKERVEEIIQNKLKKGELVKLTYRGKHLHNNKLIYKQKQIGEFNDNVKKLLLRHQNRLGGDDGFVFRTKKTQKYSLCADALLKRFHKCIQRANLRLQAECKFNRIIKHPGGYEEQFRLHDLGRHSLAKKIKTHGHIPNIVEKLALKLRNTPQVLMNRYGRATVRDYKKDYRELEGE